MGSCGWLGWLCLGGRKSLTCYLCLGELKHLSNWISVELKFFINSDAICPVLNYIFFFSFGKMLSKSPKLVVSWKRPNNSGIHTGYLSSCEQSMVQIRVTDSKSADIDIDFSKNE